MVIVAVQKKRFVLLQNAFSRKARPTKLLSGVQTKELFIPFMLKRILSLRRDSIRQMKKLGND